jgi:hypothetical protein
MLDKSSEAYGEKGYKWRNHLFYTPDIITNLYINKTHKNFKITPISIKQFTRSLGIRLRVQAKEFFLNETCATHSTMLSKGP